MAEPAPETRFDQAWPTEVDVDVVVAEAGGDIRALARTLLTEFANLAADRERQVSHGYLRRPPRPSRA
jgi:hypothetical protein